MQWRLGIACLVFAVTLPLRADEAALEPQPGILLLTSGAVIEGKIMQSGDRYFLTSEGSTIQVRAGQVAYVGQCLADCYEFKRRNSDLNRVQDHLDLAEWCLRHSLIELTERELAEAKRCDAKHPKLALLTRRLELKKNPIKTAVEPTFAQESIASTDELDRMMRGMPDGSIEMFSNAIQPMLLNHCGTASCHTATSSSKLRLIRVAAGRPQSRRATQRNLHSVLSTVDVESPQLSTLLTMPIKPHGGAKSAIFTNREAYQYKQLIDWVSVVASRNAKTMTAENDAAWPAPQPAEVVKQATKRLGIHGNLPASFAAGATPTLASAIDDANKVNEPQENPDPFQLEGSKAKTLTSDQIESATPIGEQADRSPTSPRLSRRIKAGQSSARSTPKRGEIPGNEPPQDELDPNLFNRKYLGDE